MHEQEQAALEERGRGVLSALWRLFDEALQASDFDSADVWYHEYAGAAKVMEALKLISREEYDSWTESLHNRLRRAKRLDVSPEEP